MAEASEGTKKEPFIAHGDSSSKPIILIPGLDGCTSFFDNTIPELKDEYYVLVFEIPLIEPPRTQARADRERPYDFSFFAWYLSEAMTKAGVARAPIVGESFGGFIAQRLAFDFPDRVEMLILLSSMAKAELTAAVRFKLCFVLPCVETLGLAAPRVAQRLFAVFHASDVVESHEPAWLREFFVKEASAADHYSVMARVRLAVAWDSTDELPKISCPTLIVYGEQDTFTAVGCKQLADAIPRAELVGIPGGHLPHVSRPKDFAAAIARFVGGGGASDATAVARAG